MDKRHAYRIQIVQQLFPLGFEGLGPTSIPEADTTTTQIIKNLPKIDTMIQKFAPRYPLKKIAKIDLSILRLSIYELMIDKKQPAKVIIDEAVTIAREFGNEKSYSFINGVLGSILKENKPDEDA